jgi:excisionase family DNA binding protein
MSEPEKFYSVSEAAQILGVSEETVRRWIRGKHLVAMRSGREFLISHWHLETFLFTGGEPLYEYPDLLSTCSRGLRNAVPGGWLFDQAYFKLEKQWERIKNAKVAHQKALKQIRDSTRDDIKKLRSWIGQMVNAQGLADKYQLSKEKPAVRTLSPHWSLIQRVLFMDIHFYFVAGEELRKALEDRLEKDMNDPELSSLVDKYRPIIKSFKKVRGMLQNLADKQITNPKHSGDFGNIDDKGFRFGGKHYGFHMDKVRKLRDELCDYFLSKTLPKKPTQ